MNEIDLEKTSRCYPKGDFINASYDSKFEGNFSKLVLILSTPRSGSTYLCDVIHANTGVIAHEYFQPYGYIQTLASRWSCYNDHGIIPKKYVEQLIYHRAKDGVLCVNLHGEHVKYFFHFMKFFPSCEIICIHLIRGDIISQAVSFFIAEKKGQWSSLYSPKISDTEIELDRLNVSQKIEKINSANLMASSFIHAMGFEYKVLNYENLESEAPLVIKDVFNLSSEVNWNKQKLGVKKQSNGVSLSIKSNFSIATLKEILL